MTTNSFANFPRDMAKKTAQVLGAINTRIPTVVGEMLVDGFKESFDRQRFNDTNSERWKEVERRKKESAWYGFEYRGDRRTSVAFVRDRKTGRTRRARSQRKLNFSKAATTRAILLGSGSTNLRDSIYLHTARGAKVIIASDQPHAEVHNEGGKAKIFGKKEFTMPKRQFMGTSGKLNNKARGLINRIIDNIYDKGNI